MPKIIEFLAFGEPLGITLIVISAFGALVTIAVGVRITEGRTYPHGDGDRSCPDVVLHCACVLLVFQVVFIVNISTPLVKANDPLLSFSLLFALVVTFLCSIVFLGEPQNWSCMTSQVALALGFALCLSSIMGGYTLNKKLDIIYVVICVFLYVHMAL